MDRAYSVQGGDEKCLHNFRRHHEKRLFGKHRHRFQDNIKVDIKEVGYKYVYWIEFVHINISFIIL